MSSLSSLLQPAAGKRAGAGSESIADALEALRIEAGSLTITAGAPTESGRAYGGVFPAGVLSPGAADAGAFAPYTLLNWADASDSPACLMPPPQAEQPVIETEDFLPTRYGDEPQGPACSMPVPLGRRDLLDQQGLLDLIVSRPLAEAEAYSGGDWLSGLIGSPETIAAYASDYGVGVLPHGPAEASFALWYGLLGGGNGAGDGLIVGRVDADAPALAAPSRGFVSPYEGGLS